MPKPSHDFIEYAKNNAAIMAPNEPNAEQKKRAVRAICGANACRGASDAKLILDAAGLTPTKEMLDA